MGLIITRSPKVQVFQGVLAPARKLVRVRPPRNTHLVPVHRYAPGVMLTLIFLFDLRLRLTVA
jgi:hypothetical protein